MATQILQDGKGHILPSFLCILVNVYIVQEGALTRAKIYFGHTAEEDLNMNFERYVIFDLRFLKKLIQTDLQLYEINLQLQSKSILLSQILYHNITSE